MSATGEGRQWGRPTDARWRQESDGTRVDCESDRKLHLGKVDRREFIKRARRPVSGRADRPGRGALRYRVAAQEMRRAAEGHRHRPAGVTHITDTSKGTIKLYSSWPLTGAMERTGGDAVEACTMALEDFGMRRRRFRPRVRGARRRRCRQQRRLGSRQGDRERQQGRQRRERDGLHRDLQLRRGQDLDPDHQRGRTGADLLRQHLRRA